MKSKPIKFLSDNPNGDFGTKGKTPRFSAPVGANLDKAQSGSKKGLLRKGN